MAPGADDSAGLGSFIESVLNSYPYPLESPLSAGFAGAFASPPSAGFAGAFASPPAGVFASPPAAGLSAVFEDESQPAIAKASVESRTNDKRMMNFSVRRTPVGSYETLVESKTRRVAKITATRGNTPVPTGIFF